MNKERTTLGEAAFSSGREVGFRGGLSQGLTGQDWTRGTIPASPHRKRNVHTHSSGSFALQTEIRALIHPIQSMTVPVLRITEQGYVRFLEQAFEELSQNRADPWQVSAAPILGDLSRFSEVAEEALRNYTPPRIQSAQVLDSFVGRVEAIGETKATVRMRNESGTDWKQAFCDVEVLKSEGITEGDEFRCEVVRERGETKVRFMKVPPKRLSSQRREEIRNLFQNRWED